MWLASLLRIGVLKARFIPEKHIRQIRELVTLRKSNIKTLADYKRRVHKLFETANIKISSVVSNVFGNTGRNLMNKPIDTDKDKYHRLKSRRGAKRAVVAIAHRITKAVYNIIKHGKSFIDLGEAYLMSKSKGKRIKALKLRAKYLGFSLVPLEAM